MNLKNLTDPQIQDHLRALMDSKPVSLADLSLVWPLVKARSLSRKEKIGASALLAKYRYESNLQRFTT